MRVLELYRYQTLFMKPASVNKTIEIIAAVFILVFMYTAIGKLTAHNSFHTSLVKSSLTPFAAEVLSWALPLLEILVAAMLFLPSLRLKGLIASMLLMVFFTGFIGYKLVTASRLPCSCGGIISKLSWKQHLWLNVFLATLAAIAVILNYRLKSLLQ